MDFIQSNNEHCRHFLLNGKITVDGEEKSETMADILRSCKPTTEFPSTIISFGQDGSAICGTLSEALNPAQPGHRIIVPEQESGGHCYYTQLPFGSYSFPWS